MGERILERIVDGGSAAVGTASVSER